MNNEKLDKGFKYNEGTNYKVRDLASLPSSDRLSKSQSVLVPGFTMCPVLGTNTHSAKWKVNIDLTHKNEIGYTNSHDKIECT